MTLKHIDYFKLQAKNLFRDYKTKKPYIDDIDGETYYKYEPKYFDIESIFFDYDWEEEDFSLMKAQHLLAVILGFRKWTDLLKASDSKLELARLLFDNQHKISREDWEMYIAGVERDNKQTFDQSARLEIFKHVFVNSEGHANPFTDYRINRKNT